MDHTDEYLGTAWIYNPEKRECTMHQKRYIEEVLQKFGMEDCKAGSVPLTEFHKAAPLAEPQQHPRYRELVGKLIYLLQTRPDLAYTVHVLARAAHANGREHFQLGMKVLRYLQGAKELGIKLMGERSEKDLRVRVVTDCSYGNQHDRKSTTGYLIYLGSSLIDWRSTKQSIVVTSSAAGELIAALQGADYALYVQKLTTELGVPQTSGSMVLQTDSQVMMKALNRAADTKMSRHLHIRAERLRELVQQGFFELSYLPTGEMTADLLTKALPRATHWKHTRCLTTSTQERTARHLEEVWKY